MRVLNPWTQRLLSAKLAENRPPLHSSVSNHMEWRRQEEIRKEFLETDQWSDRGVILEDEEESQG